MELLRTHSSLTVAKKIHITLSIAKISLYAYIHKLQITSFDRRITQFLICYVYVCF